MNDKTIYPDAVEEKLQYIVESSKDLEFDEPLHEECVREVFGSLLMDQWLNNTEPDLDEHAVLTLFKKAAAMSVLKDLIDEGFLDTLETDEDDLVFITEKGKQYFDSISSDPKQII